MASLTNSRTISAAAASAQEPVVGIVLGNKTYRLVDPDFVMDGAHLKKSPEQLAEERRKRKREAHVEAPESIEESDTTSAELRPPKRKCGRPVSPIAEGVSDTNYAINVIIDKIRANLAVLTLLSKRCTQHQQLLKRGNSTPQFSIQQSEREAMLDLDRVLSFLGNFSDVCAVGLALVKFAKETSWTGWDAESRTWLEQTYAPQDQSVPAESYEDS